MHVIRIMCMQSTVQLQQCGVMTLPALMCGQNALERLSIEIYTYVMREYTIYSIYICLFSV